MHRYSESIFRYPLDTELPRWDIVGRIEGMNKIPRIRRAGLVEQFMVKVDVDLDREIRMLKAEHRIDIQEMVRNYLRKELPKVKKKLEAIA